MEIHNTVLMLVIGILLGASGTLFFSKRTATMMREQIHNRDLEITELTMLLTEMETNLKNEKAGFEEKMVLVNENKELMKAEFQNIANQIMEEKSKTFAIQNKENIGLILNPLKEQIVDFKKKVEDVYDKEAQGRASLFNEITNLKSLNLRISEDAVNLTKALKGDSKSQGDWGQIVLERVLEASGLEKGREYEVQVYSHDIEGNRFFPDSIVRLPENRDVVVDSKCSLTAYERYCSAENNEEKEKALKDHLLSIKSHVKELSEKEYEKLQEVRSVDFVLMFIPNEGAYLLAIKEDPFLMFEAFKKNVIIVCPSTLMATLKIIALTWRVEKQQQNSKEIALRAGDLYDKFCSFLIVFQEMGESVKRTQDKYDLALKCLSTGKGNLIKKAEDLKALGVHGKKEIPPKLLEKSGLDSLEDQQFPDNNAMEFKELGVSDKKDIPQKLLEKCDLASHKGDQLSPDQNSESIEGGLK